jgi:small lipoprotein (TIGR04452 family)
MKKIFLIILCLNFSHCPLTNNFFLKASRVNGKDAKAILQNRLASLYVNDISTNSGDSFAAALLIPNLAGIQEDKVYSRRDVESCATKIFLAAIAIDQPQISANRTKRASAPLLTSDPNSRLFPPLLCQLKVADDLIDIN